MSTVWLTLAAVATFAAFLFELGRQWRKLTRRIGEFLDDWAGEPARPGVSARPGVMERLSIIELHQVDQTRRIDELSRRVFRRGF